MAKSFYARDRPHARIYSHWDELPAWRYLSPAARCLLVAMLMAYRPGQNGLQSWSLNRIAKAVGSGRATAATALEELESSGWITCEWIGGFGRTNRGSQFALTSFVNDRTGHLPTHAFERWEPSPGVIRARRSRVRPGGHNCPTRSTDLSGPEDRKPKLNGPVQLSEAVLKTRIFNGKAGTGRKPV